MVSPDTNRLPHNIHSTEPTQAAALASLTSQTGASDTESLSREGSVATDDIVGPILSQTGASDTESLRSREGSVTTDDSVGPIQAIIDAVLILIF